MKKGELNMKNIQTAYDILSSEEFQHKTEVMELLRENLDFIKVGSVISLGSGEYILGVVESDESKHTIVLLNLETGNRWSEPTAVKLHIIEKVAYIAKHDLDNIVGFSGYTIIKGEIK